MRKRIALIGDKTTMGGTIVSGLSNAVCFGQAIALIGDKATCPNCKKGIGTIIEGAQNMILLAKAVAYDGCRIACGCPNNLIIATQSHMFIETQASSNSSTKNSHNNSLSKSLSAEHDVPIISSPQIYNPFSKPDDEEIIIVVNNNGIGHVGFIVGSGKNAVLYDPGGSYYVKDEYGSIMRGSGDTFQENEVNLDDYLAFQREDGPKVKAYLFIIPKQQADIIRKNVDDFGGCSPLFCATCTTNVLKPSGGVFSQLSDPILMRSPWDFEQQLLDILYPERGGIISGAY